MSLSDPPFPRLENVSARVPGALARGGSPHYREGYLLDGRLSPEWERLVGAVETLSAAEKSRRWDMARRSISEQGVTYNVYGDSRGMERPWELDPLPFLIGVQEWRNIEAGLIQRARLINAVLEDCYGAQRLVASGDLPPALVFGQRDFLRSACGIGAPEGTRLNLYAADLARAADGQWWILSDRTQIPTGAGYALANRLVTARVLPEAFRELNVERLAVFFRCLRDSLARISPRPGEEPRVAILTPGPYNETYFEQAYLARYLGYSLVEGQDLIVDGGTVFLKTLSGLERIDVIMRRVDDGFCDPLELRNDSMLGVPGLVEALRSGTVAMANSLGSGLLQSPAFNSFLPGLCRGLFGEELRMPSRATWWCGQESALQYVLEHYEDLVVRPALGGSMPAGGVSKKAVCFAPHAWVGQEPMQISRVQCWEQEGWVERPMVLRVYLCATKDGYVAMPGGLARTGSGASDYGVSMQDGGASKDVWVLSEGPVEEATLLEGSHAPVVLRRVGNNLPSRLADNFFWLGRYNERLDGAARTLRAALLRFSPEAGGSGRRMLYPLLRTLELQDQLRPGSSQAGRSTEALESDFLEAVQGEERPGCLRPLAQKLVHLAMLVRDRTSNDLWRALTELERAVFSGSGAWSAAETIAILNRVLMLSASFKGIARENMTRSQGWRFLDIGQRLERALALCVFLQQTLRSPEAAHPSLLESVLEVADSTITYRSRYNLLPNLMAVYDLVLLDDTSPRSLVFQLLQLQKHLERLPRPGARPVLSEDERVTLEVLTRVRLLDPSELGQSQGLSDTETARTLEVVLQRLPVLSEVLSASFFTHSRVSSVRT
jgi:uncharacterized circularly permuted ATP-grasp superfamily protein/uncharacterized alpha-E superfamily protein